MVFIDTGLPVCNLLKVKCESYSVFERYSKTSLLKAETNPQANFWGKKNPKPYEKTNFPDRDPSVEKRIN